MSNLLRDLLNLQKHIQEDETEVKKPAAVPAANPVSSEPVVQAAVETEPVVAATEEPAEPTEEPVEEDDKPEYDDSAEFTEDFYDFVEKIDHVHKLINSAKFKHWMKITDENFSTQTQQHVASIAEQMEALKEVVQALTTELESAE